MVLLPYPVQLSREEGQFLLRDDTLIVLDAQGFPEDWDAALLLQKEAARSLGAQLSVTREFSPECRNSIVLGRGEDREWDYTLRVTPEGVSLRAAAPEGVFHGVQTLRQLLRTEGRLLPGLTIRDRPDYEVRGFYHDVARGRVPRLETLMALADELALYKINQFHLYFEHAFAFRDQQEVWAGADPMTPEELLRLDAYCRRLHIELIPSLSSFGHLYHALRSKKYRHLAEVPEEEGRPFSFYDRMRHHTLDISNPESLTFAEGMIDELAPLFSSRKINVGCDETFDLGKGRSRELVQQKGKGRAYVDFLSLLAQHTESLGRKPMFWGDIVLQHPELLPELPKNAVWMNWIYEPEIDERKIAAVADAGLEQYVCPGVSGWNRLVCAMDDASRNIRNMARAGKKYGAVGLLNTNWGDFGTLNPLACSIPGMILGAAVSWNGGTEDDGAFDRDVSLLEYGDREEKLVGILRELSRCQIVTWEHLVFWYESRALGLRSERSDRAEKALFGLAPEALLQGAEKAREAEEELLFCRERISPEKRGDADVLALCARGVGLLDELALFLKPEGKSRPGAAELADRLERWTGDYCRAWRQEDKESELFRLCRILDYAVEFLRS